MSSILGRSCAQPTHPGAAFVLLSKRKSAGGGLHFRRKGAFTCPHPDGEHAIKERLDSYSGVLVSSSACPRTQTFRPKRSRGKKKNNPPAPRRHKKEFPPATKLLPSPYTTLELPMRKTLREMPPVERATVRIEKSAPYCRKNLYVFVTKRGRALRPFISSTGGLTGTPGRKDHRV